jgi:hypothetical protein
MPPLTVGVQAYDLLIRFVRNNWIKEIVHHICGPDVKVIGAAH